MAFVDYTNELQGWIPKLSIFLAQKMVNRAWLDIKQSRAWSFLVKEAVLQAPTQIIGGKAAVTQFSNLVTPDATAKPLWLAAGANPAITQRQFRLAAGPLYSIIAIDGVTGVITLDRNYQELTNATATYLIYRAYYAAPEQNFLRWVTVLDPLTGYWLKLNWTKAEIDRIDPTRGYFGNPTRIASYKTDPLATSPTFGFPMYELWAHPTSAVSYQGLYQTRGTPMVLATDAIHPAIPEEVLMSKAGSISALWAEQNKGKFPELRGVDWRFAKAAHDAEYKRTLMEAQRQDEETFLQNWVIPNDAQSYLSPIDSKYAQSHDVNWM